jgi:FtsZ-binding cell division protein ZapB
MRSNLQRKDSELDVERRRIQSLGNIKEQNILLQLEVREYKQERERLHQSIQDLSSEWDRTNTKMQEDY